MPELPEVETTCQGLLPLIGSQVQQVVIRNASMRWPIPNHLHQTLVGSTLIALTRRAKYILAKFELGFTQPGTQTGSPVSTQSSPQYGTLLLHLGMSGRIQLLAADEAPQKHDHFDIHFINGPLNIGQVLRLRDPRRFGAVLWAGEHPQDHPLLAVLGPEPLEDTFTAKYLHTHITKRSMAIKNVIMDSHLVVGVGNIYASESLFRARIDPQTPANQLSLAACERLVAEIKSTLIDALAAGGSSLRDFFGTDGKPGYFQQAYFVYGRTSQPCKICGAPIQMVRLGQRSTFYCAVCQQ